MISIKRIKRVTVKKIILDFIPAFLGVLIALLLNNYVENRKENRFLKQSFQNVYNINKENIKAIEASIKNIKNNVDTLNFYKNNNKSTIFDCIAANKGISVKTQKKISLHIFRDSRFLTKIDFNLISLFGELEENHTEISQSYKNRMVYILQSEVYSTDYKSKELLILALNDYISGMMQIEKCSKEINNYLLEKELVEDNL